MPSVSDKRKHFFFLERKTTKGVDRDDDDDNDDDLAALPARPNRGMGACFLKTRKKKHEERKKARVK